MNHYTLFPLHPPLMNLEGRPERGSATTKKASRHPRASSAQFSLPGVT